MGFQNFFATRLATDITATDSIVTLEAVPTTPTGRLVLEARNPTQREVIKYTGISGNQITGVLRGQGGTTAKPHIKGSLVEMNLTAEDLDDALGVPNDIVTRFSELFSDSVVKGTGLVAVTTGLTASISDITFYIGGERYNQANIANKTFTASRDTYCRISNTGVVSYDEVANGAAMPVLPAHNIYFAKVVTEASSISSITQMSVGAVTSDTLAQSAVTPEKRSGGFHFESIELPNGTGPYTITEIPFRPKALIVLGSNSASSQTVIGFGWAQDSTPIRQGFNIASTGGTEADTNAAMVSAIGNGTINYRAAVTSFNDDGITINRSVSTGARRFNILFLG